ncbi:MAG: hypothetical protein C4326_00430 [Ignavibacteria bacterium]
MTTATSSASVSSSEQTSSIIRVLAVDDMPENLQLLREVLAGHGFDVLAASSGEEALRLLEQSLIHLIVADAMMPSMDGFQLCREVKRRPSLASIPFIIYTGHYVDVEDQEFAKTIGVDAYVMKYDGLATLLQTIDQLLRQRYGSSSELTAREEAGVPPEEDELAFLQRHHALIVKKLEEKMHELEVYAETLARKNRELQASESRYRNLFEHASIGIFILDKATGALLDMNAEGLSLLGYSRDEVLALPPLSFVEDKATANSILQSGAFFSKETLFRRRDGGLVEVELAVGPYEEQGDRKLVLYALDITDQKKMRRHLLQSEKMAFMGRLAASIAHDIRNPLAAITLNLQYIAKRLPADFSEKAALDFAIEGAQRISKIVENTLSLARIAPPIVRLEDINPIVEKAIRFLDTQIAQKHITVETDFAPNLPKVNVEAKQIEQVVLNLVQNAIDCTPENGTISVSTCLIEDLKAPAGANSQRVAVVVLDRGPSIPPEQLRHLFEPFHTTKVGGTGLGLALSKQIMDKHRAEIRIEPAVGGGTIARLIFPVVQQSSGD